jgi:hypothetical protein
MANTTNYNWETPDDTDLVKDGAAAIRTLGSSIDTTTKALNPSTTLGDIEYRSATANTNTRLAIGTTGQVLSVVGGVPAWATSDDANAIQNAIVDAKGDIVAASANDTPARLAVGTDNQRLVAASGETTGLKYVADTQNTVVDAEGDLLVGDSADTLQRLAIGSNTQVLTVDTAVDGKIKWATPASGGGMTSLASGSLSGASLDLTGISGSYKNLQLVLRNGDVGATELTFRLNNLSTGIYSRTTLANNAGTFASVATVTATSFALSYNNIDNTLATIINIFDYTNTTSHKQISAQSDYTKAGGGQESLFLFGACRTTSAIDRITVSPGSGNFDAGTYILYGVN